jgi:hypothetical protein
MCLYETDVGPNSVDDGEEIILSSDIDTDGEVGLFLDHELQEGSRSGILVFICPVGIAA